MYLKTVKLSDHIETLNMSDFSEAIFEKKLVELRDSQKEIQALSQFCVHHRQHARIVVKVNSFISEKTDYNEGYLRFGIKISRR